MRNSKLLLRRLATLVPITLLVPIALMFVSVQQGCASLTSPQAQNNPQYSYRQLIQQHQFVSNEVKGSHFNHLVVKNQAALTNHLTGKPLHIYLEGDGFTWQKGTKVSADPTPKNPVMLKLMAMDPNPAIYLGRPCYFHVKDTACNPFYWTIARYHSSVIQSLRAALRQEIDTYTEPPASVRLFGFSGGGSLAYLMAADFEGVNTVVTLGSNLDTSGWMEELKTGNILKLSQNPLDFPPQPHTSYLHIEGTKDKIVSNHSTLKHKQQFPSVDYPNLQWCSLPVDHSCCWQDYWPTLIDQLNVLEESMSSFKFCELFSEPSTSKSTNTAQ